MRSLFTPQVRLCEDTALSPSLGTDETAMQTMDLFIPPSLLEFTVGPGRTQDIGEEKRSHLGASMFCDS